MDDYVPIGERIALYRRRHGLSQIRLGGLIDRSEDWVSKVERGVIPVDRVTVLVRVAAALHVSLAELLTDPRPAPGGGNGDPPAIRGLRRWLSGLPDGTARPLPALRDDLAASTRLRTAGRYTDLGAMLPGLLGDLEATAWDEPAALPLLVRAYGDAEVLARMRGAVDLAWIAADRGLRTAERTGDPRLWGEAAFWLVSSHLASGKLDEVVRVAEAVVSRLRPEAADPEVRALTGAVRLPVGIALARRGDAPEPAFEVADRLARDRDGRPDVPAVVFARTQFGAANVALHRVSAAVEEGRPRDALRLARRVDTTGLPPSRTARLRMDEAAAYAQRRDTAGMLSSLLAAEAISPEFVRHVPLVREVVHQALRRQRGAGNPALQQLAERVGAV